MTRAVFLGTPVEAIPSLTALSTLADLAVVITQPDRPRGRSGTPLPPPVKEAALALGIAVAQPGSVAALSRAVADAGDIDVGVLVAYGRLVPAGVLQMATHGFLNVHFSLLPQWRGAAPIERAILAGDTVSGVTIIRMDEGLDTGPVVAVREVAIGSQDTAQTLSQKLSQRGADLLEEVLGDYLSGGRPPLPQEGKVTYAEKLDPAEARLDLSAPASELVRVVRAFNPRPGAFAEREGERFKLWEVAQGPPLELAPGELSVDAARLLMGTGEGTLELVEVQPAGGLRMGGMAWAHGRPGPLGSLD